MVPHWFGTKDFVEVTSPSGTTVRVREGKRRDPFSVVAFGTQYPDKATAYFHVSGRNLTLTLTPTLTPNCWSSRGEGWLCVSEPNTPREVLAFFFGRLFRTRLARCLAACCFHAS